MKVRLEQIAARAGVSISTVSRVLNEKPGVSPSTRRVVLTALDVLGYERPARLRPRTSGLMGLIVPELENPFFPRLAGQLEIDLARVGYTAVLCSQSLGGVHEDDYVQTLLEHGVAGIVFVSGIHAVADTDPARYRRLTGNGLPVVLVNGHLPGSGAASVSVDDGTVVDLAVRHLADMGHRRIALAVGQVRYTPCIRRAAGFRVAMRAHVDADLTDAALDELTSYTTFTVEGGIEAAERLLDLGVTGFVCGSDIIALGVIRCARDRGLRVPEDVSVVGADDSLMTEFTDPPLTTVRQPTSALGKAVCRTMLGMVAGDPAPTTETLVKPELVVRASAGRAPVP
ncbi:MAG: LacI family DNA-binding transcriptional regulator [Acidimicrobiales bacterium]